MKIRLAAGLAVLAATVLVGALWAAQSVNVEQSTTAEFQGGGTATFDDAVVNNLGELRLAHKLDSLLKADKDVAFVNALAADRKGNVFAATAPKGKLFRIAADGTCELYYTAKEKTLQSLAVGPDNELYLGTGGGDGRVYRVLAKNKAELVLERKGLAYVWSMVVLSDGRIVAGTGPSAELIVVTPGEKPSAGEVLYKPEKEKQKNVLSVAATADGKTVYFGTDTEGLIFKFDMQLKRPFLLYDANETEIACLAVGADGVLYAGTSDPRQAGGEGGRGPMELDGQPASQPGHVQTSGPGDDSTGGSGAEADDGDDDEGGGEPIQAAAPGRPAGGAVIGLVVPGAMQGRSARAGQFRDAMEQMISGGQPAGPRDATAAPPATSQPEAKAPKAAPSAGRPAGRAPASQPEAGVGKPPGKAGGAAAEAMMARMRSMMGGRGGRPSGEGPEQGGNAVYRIDSQGFVTEILRQPTMMLSLLVQGTRVIVGTGTDGKEGSRVLAVTPGAEEIATLARPKDVKQVMAMAAGKDGTIFIGTANEAIIGRIAVGYAAKGTFTSAPIDAKQPSRWGVIRAQGDLPTGTTVRVQTRSGNLAEPEDALWSAWGEPVAAADPVQISSPSARFIQYRVVLASDKDDTTPVVRNVRVSYANENQPPKVLAIKAVTPGSGGPGGEEAGEGGPQVGMKMPPAMMRRMGGGGPGGPAGEEGPQAGGFVMLMWKAVDPNDDTLEFTLFFKREGTTAWVPILEKPIRDTKFRWITRGVPDGVYRIKVVASDLPANPASAAKEDSRITSPITIDNTPPVINNFRTVEQKDAKVTFAADATDALSRLASAEARVDSTTEDGQVLQPVDGIWDQRNESLRFTVDLASKAAGAHLVILNVTDAAGNVASAALEVVKP